MFLLYPLLWNTPGLMRDHLSLNGLDLEVGLVLSSSAFPPSESENVLDFPLEGFSFPSLLLPGHSGKAHLSTPRPSRRSPWLPVLTDTIDTDFKYSRERITVLLKHLPWLAVTEWIFTSGAQWVFRISQEFLPHTPQGSVPAIWGPWGPMNRLCTTLLSPYTHSLQNPVYTSFIKF